MGKTTAPHWKTPLTEMNFPGKGYIPQALTHGTVQCNNLEETRNFYEEVLGLEVVQLWPNSLYVKHQSSPWYVVNLQAPPETRRYMRQQQRFTLALESADAVYNAREWLNQHQGDFAISELFNIQNENSGPSFLLSDLNQNWWEITSPSAVKSIERS
jgi:catechol 2,3-dioxygenase-like lactoylglutathione lyase family enzyme